MNYYRVYFYKQYENPRQCIILYAPSRAQCVRIIKAAFPGASSIETLKLEV
jgi:hypothetical protein